MNEVSQRQKRIRVRISQGAYSIFLLQKNKKKKKKKTIRKMIKDYTHQIKKKINQFYYSCEPLHMDEQRQNDQLEPTYSSSVLIWDVALKTCQKQWTIEKGGEKGSRISMLITWHDDDDMTFLEHKHTLV